MVATMASTEAMLVQEAIFARTSSEWMGLLVVMPWLKVPLKKHFPPSESVLI
jgi:hypothetical protein